VTLVASADELWAPKKPRPRPRSSPTAMARGR
jgi:hypothetical protein